MGTDKIALIETDIRYIWTTVIGGFIFLLAALSTCLWVGYSRLDDKISLKSDKEYIQERFKVVEGRLDKLEDRVGKIELRMERVEAKLDAILDRLPKK